MNFKMMTVIVLSLACVKGTHALPVPPRVPVGTHLEGGVQDNQRMSLPSFGSPIVVRPRATPAPATVTTPHSFGRPIVVRPRSTPAPVTVTTAEPVMVTTPAPETTIPSTVTTAEPVTVTTPTPEITTESQPMVYGPHQPTFGPDLPVYGPHLPDYRKMKRIRKNMRKAAKRQKRDEL